MKKATRIAALAVIMVLALISCSPEAELSDYFWSDANSQFDPQKNTSAWEFQWFNFYPTDLGVPFGTYQPAQTIDLQFPTKADVLREQGNAKIEAKLKEFLTFHSYSEIDPLTPPPEGKASTLSVVTLNYEVINRNIDTITVKLQNPAVAALRSHIVARIDGTQYTYARGIKMDQDYWPAYIWGFGETPGNGIAGEAIYDDYYQQIWVYNLPLVGALSPLEPVLPGNRGWSFALGALAYFTSQEGDAYTYPDPLRVATLDAPDCPNDPVYHTVNQEFVNCFSLEKFAIKSEDRKWVPYGGTAPAYSTIYYQIELGGFRMNTMNLYRTVWKSNVPMVTNDEYYGVKQRISIWGASGSDDYGNNNDGQKVKVGPVFGYFDSATPQFVAKNYLSDIPPPSPPSPTMHTAPSVAVYSQDLYNRNVVIDFRINPIYTPAISDWHWLIKFDDSASRKEIFKRNFRIGYTRDGAPFSPIDGSDQATEDNFKYRDDIVYITIKDVEFVTDKSFGVASGLGPTAGFGANVIRITLDPTYQINPENVNRDKVFYIGPEIGHMNYRTYFGDYENTSNEDSYLFQAVAAPWWSF